MKKYPLHLILLLIIFSGTTALYCLKADLSFAKAGKEIINPHWTAKDCGECHLQDRPKGKSAKLKFDGSPIKLCDRCHKTEFARADIHPVGVAPFKEMEKIFPRGFPRKDGEIDCLTCHDAILQMTDDFANKTSNPKFIRGGPYETLVSFCFICHPPEEYQKTNPHKQLDSQGKMIEKNCLFCHLSLPKPEQVENIGEVAFKGELAHYCINCHPEFKKGHPARADHLVKLSDSMEEALTSQTATLQVDLPLNGETIFCGTCHNPHEKGVIQRKEARYGAGEKFFLRLNGGYELCVSCHGDKKLGGTDEHDLPKKEYSKYRQKILSNHQPVTENKCKLCHVITPENMQKPGAMFLCFKQGCHQTEILEKEFRHEKTVVENCYLCHRSHSSVNEKLLNNSKENICKSCHPLLRDKNEEVSLQTEAQTSKEDNSMDNETFIKVEKPQTSKEDYSMDNETFIKVEKPQTSKEHTIFTQYIKTTPVPEGNECGFCHSTLHKKLVTQLDMKICSGCHKFVQEILSSASSVPINIHQTFEEKSCCVCHDPHAAPNRYLIKQNKVRNDYTKAQPQNE